MRLSRPSFSQSLAATGLAVALSCTALPAFAHDGADHRANPVAAEQARQQATDHTQALVALQKHWQKAQGAEKSRALQQLVAKAEERRAFLAELVRTNPAEVLRVAIPEEKQIGMPAEVIEKLEQKLELEGEYEARYEDYDDGRHKLRRFLNTRFGEQFGLHFTGEAPEINSNASIRVQGVLLANDSGSDTDGEVVLSSEDDSSLNLAYAGSTQASTDLGLSSNTFGEQRTLLMLVNFQDKREEPYTRAYAQTMLFGDINNYYRENSFDQAWLSGDVVGWYTIPVSSTNCSTSTIASEAKAAASARGMDLSAYDRFVYAFPENACGFSGTATVGGTPSQAWIRGDFSFEVVSHEIGHNFGLHHSHSLNCTNGNSIGAGNPIVGYGVDPYPGCSNLEYGDGVDVMGWSSSAHFNSYQKEHIGWLDYGSSPAITTVESSGTYTIYPYAAQNGQPKALKVLKSVDPYTGNRTWYYVEFRQPVGFDGVIDDSFMEGNMLDTANILNGVAVHAKYDVGGNMGYLLDMTPESYQLYTEDPALEVGRSFNSPDGDLTITTVSTEGGKAVVDISFGETTTQSCTRSKPSLTFSPAQGPWVTAGTAVSYTVTVTNNDSSTCSNSSYSLNASKPSGWSTTFGSSSLSLAPGKSASTTLKVTSASTAADGFYNIGVSATSGSYSASGNVTYVVDNPSVSNSAPVAVNDDTDTSGNAVTIAVLGNDYDPDGDTLRVTGVTQGAKGSVRINADGTLIYTPAKNFRNGDSFNYTISDGNRNASATVNVSATGTSSGAGGKGNGKGPNK
jgi:hypothetical protein